MNLASPVEDFLTRSRDTFDRRFRGTPLVGETPGPLAEWKKEIGRIRGLVTPRPARKRAPRRA